MILSNREIRMEIAAGNLVIEPPVSDSDYSTTAVDLHLGDTIGEFKPPAEGLLVQVDLSNVEVGSLVAPNQEELIQWKKIPGGGYPLKPRDFVLAYTLERITLPSHLAARVEGRSTIARFGVAIHSTAPTVHATFSGALALEVSNNGPFPYLLVPGMKVCQLIIERVTVPPFSALESRWMNQGPPAV